MHCVFSSSDWMSADFFAFHMTFFYGVCIVLSPHYFESVYHVNSKVSACDWLRIRVMYVVAVGLCIGYNNKKPMFPIIYMTWGGPNIRRLSLIVNNREAVSRCFQICF